MKNNYAFIDSQNLHMGTQVSGWKLDFLKFGNYLKTKYNVEKAYLFIGYIPTNANLYKHLQEFGYTLVFKPVLEIRKDSKKEYKGNVDAELVLHTIINIGKYNKAVIVSGDGDFHCLVEYLDEKGKLAKIPTPNKRYSSLLRKYSKYIYYLWGLLRINLSYKYKEEVFPREASLPFGSPLIIMQSLYYYISFVSNSVQAGDIGNTFRVESTYSIGVN